ncbi:hypothetical protein BU25DRAFT_239250 [Macroventuria anomochaeta]|uniref:Uncharacterized protein n=1 Tax=Macroventuria anomochaeta TaxID=301207 RepID=A0ACB6RI13_9PLEO|nr:uncharacterized protein BU25DRAFT_239250 [Macroventuria anomochaeta]KAF2621394.1 hypothetical protein BU25DRAFT_239250 [Macroventuria anomochaeta]
MKGRKLWQSESRCYIHPWHRYDKTVCSDVRDRMSSMISFIDSVIAVTLDYDKSALEPFVELVDHQLQHDDIYGFMSSIWNLLEILELDEDDKTIQRYLNKWESEGMLDFTLKLGFKENDQLCPSIRGEQPHPFSTSRSIVYICAVFRPILLH